MRTDVVCVELVNSNEDANSSQSKTPLAQGAEDWELAFVEVIEQNLVEALGGYG
jgi:hypothetical protein